MESEARLLECLDLKRRADRLGIPFTSAMTLAELTAAVTARESDMDKPKYAFVNGQWEINGDLPNGLTFVDGHFIAPPDSAQPECFGELWDGAAGGAAECGTCAFSPVCREVMGQIAFVAAQARLGPDATLPALAKECEVSEQSILVLMALKQGQAVPEAAPKKKRPPPKPEPEPEAAKPEPEAAKPEAPPPAPTPAPEAATMPAEKAAETALPGQGELPAQQERDLRKKPAKKKAKLAKAKAAEPAVIAGPPKARPVKRAKAGARARKAKSAKPAKARVGAPLGEKWGRHTWMTRWTRERERSPLIRRAVPGSVIQVERLGKTYQVKVFKGYYTINGKDCPTLCEAAKLATGNANWSAVKFWGLDKVAQVPPKPPA